jgi:hypothetical protein
MFAHVHSFFFSFYFFNEGKSKAEGSNNSFSIRRDIWNLLLSLSSLYALVLLEVSKQKSERIFMLLHFTLSSFSTLMEVTRG